MTIRTLAAIIAVAVAATGSTLHAQGNQHLKIKGVETPVVILPGWTSFTTQQALSIPSLQVDELIITIDWTSPGSISTQAGGFKGYGTGIINDESGEVIGEVTFYYMGQSLSPPPVIEYIGEIKAVGTFFAGSLEGLVITETIVMEGIAEIGPTGMPTYPYYLGHVDGFLTVPEFIDFQELKKAFKSE